MIVKCFAVNEVSWSKQGHASAAYACNVRKQMQTPAVGPLCTSVCKRGRPMTFTQARAGYMGAELRWRTTMHGADEAQCRQQCPHLVTLVQPKLGAPLGPSLAHWYTVLVASSPTTGPPEVPPEPDDRPCTATFGNDTVRSVKARGLVRCRYFQARQHGARSHPFQISTAHGTCLHLSCCTHSRVQPMPVIACSPGFHVLGSPYLPSIRAVHLRLSPWQSL